MTITLTIDGKAITLQHYCGWSEPGRTPELNFKNKSDLPLQLIKIEYALNVFIEKNMKFNQDSLENMTGISPSAWRQIRTIMNKLDILSCLIKQNEYIAAKEPFSIKGKAFNAITNKRLENKFNYNSLLPIHRMIWSDLFLYYKMDNPNNLYPVRIVVKALMRNGYLTRTEWDILTTFTEHNDNAIEEQIVDTFIKNCRIDSQPYKLIKRIEVESEKGRKSIQNCRNTYWSNLEQGGLIKKEKNKNNEEIIRLDYTYQSLINVIISEDFFTKLSELN